VAATSQAPFDMGVNQLQGDHQVSVHMYDVFWNGGKDCFFI